MWVGTTSKAIVLRANAQHAHQQGGSKVGASDQENLFVEISLTMFDFGRSAVFYFGWLALCVAYLRRERQG